MLRAFSVHVGAGNSGNVGGGGRARRGLGIFKKARRGAFSGVIGERGKRDHGNHHGGKAVGVGEKSRLRCRPRALILWLRLDLNNVRKFENAQTLFIR